MSRLRVYGRVRRLQRLDQLLDVHRLGEEQIPEEDEQTDRREQSWQHGRRQRRVSQATSRQPLCQPVSRCTRGQPSVPRIGWQCDSFADIPASMHLRWNSSVTFAVCATMKGRMRVGSCCARMTRVHSMPSITSIDASMRMHSISRPWSASRARISSASRPLAATKIS